jgi:hypothetical protein
MQPPHPSPLPQAGGEGKGEGVPFSVKGFVAFVLLKIRLLLGEFNSAKERKKFHFLYRAGMIETPLR